MISRLAVFTALGLGLPVAVTGPPEARMSSTALAEEAAVGIVEGTVQLEVATEGAPTMLSPYARRRYRPPGPSPSASSASDVVIYLLLDRSPPAPANARATIRQSDLAIVPHLTVVQSGTRIDFPNQDEVFHNIFSLSQTHPFNLGRYPPGESRSERFSEPGVLRMFCDIHSEMSGVILVVGSPFFARPDESGRFQLTGVPEGRHRLVAWHESAGADTATVVVTSSGVTRANFQLPR
jgi:plastocyanin